MSEAEEARGEGEQDELEGSSKPADGGEELGAPMVEQDAAELADHVAVESAESAVVGQDVTEDEQAGAEGGASSASVSGSARGPIEEVLDEEEDIKMDWYILKVQSNRENTICDALRRRVSVAGLDEYFGEIMVPTEDIAEFKNGKKKIVKRKLYPWLHRCAHGD